MTRSTSDEELTPMTTREEASALVQRMQECFNSRRFDEADDLSTPDCFSHPLGAAGVEAGKQAWRMLTLRFPGMRVVAQDILVDGDKVAVRSAVEGIVIPGGPQPALFEIFRIDGGRLAESWGASSGFPAAESPEQLLS
jgi:predicted SnoaL-like aldol condensation-catalyzing enzyme